MKRIAIAAALGFTGLIAGSATAGSPHFVAVSAELDGNNVFVSGKEAGLGNETEVFIQVSGDAACINPGEKKPKAANKETFTASGYFPVQNGKANFSLTLSATFQPNCSPPMEVVWGPITVTDTSHGVTTTIRL